MPYGPYSATITKGKRTIDYLGNRNTAPFADVLATQIFSDAEHGGRLESLVRDKSYVHLHRIDNAIFNAAVDYFRSMKAEWCNLPLTTRMISSPGEIYAGRKLNYTTDALPVELTWFDEKRPIFLSESSQFYLELCLLLEKTDHVFSIYNSFRKEKADATHLAEFQHIEFEGKIDQKKNIEVFLGLLGHITNIIIRDYSDDLLHFISKEEVGLLENSFTEKSVRYMTFREALDMLRDATHDERYKDFTLKNFGSWEEIKLTEICGSHVLVTEFPLIEIPFYHDRKKTDGIPVAQNADLILYGYREVVGSGTRISDPDALKEKALQFSLPVQDYAPYLRMRNFPGYRTTSGFGLGWQRYVHWLLKLPTIWHATLIPRGHVMTEL